MRITPLEIRQKNFEKKLRGYDKDEVNAFLLSLSNEWERIVDENKELKIKLEQSEKEVLKLREVESSLFKTLKTAEDTGANLIDQANKAAELHLREAEINAQAVMEEAKSKAKAIIENSEVEAKDIIDEMQEAVKELEKNYKSIESQRDTLIGELGNLADDIKDRIQRTTRQHHKFKLEDHLIKVKNLVRESEARINKEHLSIHAARSEAIPDVDPNSEEADKKLDTYIKSKANSLAESITPEPEEEEENKNELSGEGSFFDQVDN